MTTQSSAYYDCIYLKIAHSQVVLVATGMKTTGPHYEDLVKYESCKFPGLEYDNTFDLASYWRSEIQREYESPYSLETVKEIENRIKGKLGVESDESL